MAPSAESEANSSEVRFRGTRNEDQKFLEENAKKDGVTTLPSGLQYRVLKEQPDKSKPKPKAATPCRCHYRGRLVDGTEFDSSYKRSKPTTFAPNQVVKGWTEALQLMREGEKWELVLPANLAYGERGAPGKIPPGAALIFELEIVAIDGDDGSSWKPFGVFAAAAAVAIVLYFVCQAFLGAGAPMGPTVSLEDASVDSNPLVFFDIEIAGAPAGRVEFELFSKIAPKTAENFRALATGEKSTDKKSLHFKGSKFHRIMPGFMCQGGDITHGNGRGGESIYGSTFPDEWDQGVVKHTEPGLLSMANRGKNTNGSQFFITVAATSWLDGKHVVFGRVTKGMEIVRKMEATGSSRGTPDREVKIVDSGELTRQTS